MAPDPSTLQDFDEAFGADYEDEAEARRREADADLDERTDAALIQNAGRILVLRLATLMRTARNYDLDNATGAQLLEGFLAGMRDAFRVVDPIELIFYEGAFFLSERRVKTDASAREMVRELGRMFFKRKIGGIQVDGDVTDIEIRHFVEGFVSVEDSEQPRQDLIDYLEEREVSTFRFSRMMKMGRNKDDEKKRDGKSASLELYAEVMAELPDISSMLIANTEGGDAQDGSAGGSGQSRATQMVQGLVESAEADEGSLMALTTIKGVSDYALSHSVNVSILATALGRRLSFKRKELSELASAALFHNIGQTSMDPALLNKPDPLSVEDRDEIQGHPLRGFRAILSSQGVTNHSVRRALVALEHHMWFNGRGGYPYIPGHKPHLYSRIVAICDCYEALVSPRPYRSAFQPDIAVKLMQRDAGTHFDPVLLRLFTDMLGKWPIGSLVELDDGKLAVCVGPGQGKNRFSRPQVLVVRDALGRDLEPELVDLSIKIEGRKAYQATIVRSHSPDLLGFNVSSFLFPKASVEAASVD